MKTTALLLGALLTFPLSLQVPAAFAATSLCPAFIKIPTDMNLDGRYTAGDKSHSNIDAEKSAAYELAVAPFRAEVKNITVLADKYRDTTDARIRKDIVRCMGDHLQALATDNAMGRPVSSLDRVLQGWVTGGLAVAVLKVSPDLPASRDMTSINAWMTRNIDSVITFYTTTDPKELQVTAGQKINNLRYWAGFAATATGMVVHNPKFIKFGKDSANLGLEQVAADGTLPLEAKRGNLALHYHNYALAPLAGIALLTDPRSVKMYRSNSRAMERLANAVLTSAQTNGGVIAQRAGVKQQTLDSFEGLALMCNGVKGADVNLQNRLNGFMANKAPATYLYLGGRLDYLCARAF